jgi:hypothetical protein
MTGKSTFECLHQRNVYYTVINNFQSLIYKPSFFQLFSRILLFNYRVQILHRNLRYVAKRIAMIYVSLRHFFCVITSVPPRTCSHKKSTKNCLFHGVENIPRQSSRVVILCVMKIFIIHLSVFCATLPQNEFLRSTCTLGYHVMIWRARGNKINSAISY